MFYSFRLRPLFVPAHPPFSAFGTLDSAPTLLPTDLTDGDKDYFYSLKNLFCDNR